MDKNSKKATESSEVPEEVDNVEKIRDILFGTQSKEIDQRFRQLEGNISDQLAAMQKENVLQFQEIQNTVDSEVGILDSKLSSSEKSGFDEMDKIEAELKSQVKKIEANFEKSNEALEKLSRDVNDKIDQLNASIQKDLEKRFNQTNSIIEKHHQALSESKVDKSALSKMFTGLAEQLSPKKK